MIERLKELRSAAAAWCDAHFVPEWRRCWKLASCWLAGLAGVVGAYFGDPANSASWTATLYGIPPEYRKLIPGALFLLLASVPTIVRLWRQKAPNG